MKLLEKIILSFKQTEGNIEDQFSVIFNFFVPLILCKYLHINDFFNGIDGSNVLAIKLEVMLELSESKPIDSLTPVIIVTVL